MKYFYVLLILILTFNITALKSFSMEFMYILNEENINSSYEKARETIIDTDIFLIKTPLGLIIRFEIEEPLREYEKLTPKTIKKLNKIENFLAKNKNPVIIEVHIDKKRMHYYFKNWEITTVISNKIADFLKGNKNIKYENSIFSIGYGEFLPSNNTSNNGGKINNRVDIIILCNISGE